MSVTKAFSLAIAQAVADWGKSAKATFRLSAGSDKAVAKMGEDTLELSTRTGNLTVRPPSGRAVAVVGIGSDGVLRIDCGNGPAELGDAKLAEAVAETVRTVKAAHERSAARGNRTSFTLAPAGDVGIRMHDELDGKYWLWLTTESEIAEDQKAMGHDFEDEPGVAVVLSLRRKGGRRIGTALLGTEGVFDYVSKTEMPAGLSGLHAIQARLSNAPESIDLALGEGEWETDDGFVTLDSRDLMHNVFGPALRCGEHGPGSEPAYYFMLDGQRVLVAEYPVAAAARAAQDDPSLAGDETRDTVTKWLEARLDAEAERVAAHDGADILEIDGDDDYFAEDGTLFDRMRAIATAENVERMCIFLRCILEGNDRQRLVEVGFAKGYLKPDHADPKRLAGFMKKAGAPADLVKAVRALDPERAAEAVPLLMRAKLTEDWSGFEAAPKAPTRRAA